MKCRGFKIDKSKYHSLDYFQEAHIQKKKTKTLEYFNIYFVQNIFNKTRQMQQTTYDVPHRDGRGLESVLVIRGLESPRIR